MPVLCRREREREREDRVWLIALTEAHERTNVRTHVRMHARAAGDGTAGLDIFLYYCFFFPLKNNNNNNKANQKSGSSCIHASLNLTLSCWDKLWDVSARLSKTGASQYERISCFSLIMHGFFPPFFLIFVCFVDLLLIISTGRL